VGNGFARCLIHDVLGEHAADDAVGERLDDARALHDGLDLDAAHVVVADVNLMEFGGKDRLHHLVGEDRALLCEDSAVVEGSLAHDFLAAELAHDGSVCLLALSRIRLAERDALRDHGVADRPLRVDGGAAHHDLADVAFADGLEDLVVERRVLRVEDLLRLGVIDRRREEASHEAVDEEFECVKRRLCHACTHLQEVDRRDVAVLLADDDILCHVDKAAREVARVRRTECRIGKTLARTVRGDEVVGNGQALTEVRRDRQVDDLTRWVSHEAAHARELTHLLLVASSTRVRHHKDGVKGIHVVHHGVRDVVRRLCPELDDLFIALVLSDETTRELTLDLIDLRLRVRDDFLFLRRHDDVGDGDRHARNAGVVVAEVLHVVNDLSGLSCAEMIVAVRDEFAELKKEQPEFMAELVSTARVGRSLGVHLILATQKPTGIVDDQIWSNSRFKLCLKVQNEADSRELLHSGDAANITNPGRAYLQVGNNEIFELFQSAYSGGAYSIEKEQSEADERIFVLNELGQGRLINEDLSLGESNDITKITQLDAVVDHIKDIYEAEPCTEVKKPWLPPLAAEIINPNITNIKVGELPDTSFDVGIIDMPDKQKQEVYTHDFSKYGNMAIFGTSKVGKSTAATNAILSLAAKNSPNTLNMYIVDFGNTALFALKDLPQVADYISFDDTEKFRKLRNILSDEISARKKKFARYNVTTLEMYNASGSEIMPAIVVVIDNYDVIKEIDYDLENYFTQLTRDGVGVGIYTFVTATRANAMKYAVLNNFGARICNFMSDSSEIVSLIGRSEYKLSDVKGRALVSKDNVYLMQEFLPVRCEHKSHYNIELQRMVEAIKNANVGTAAEKISVLPDDVNFEDIILDKVDGDNRIAIGLDSEKVAPYYIDNRSQVKLILGPVQSGKTNALKVILEQLNNEKIFLFDSRTRDLDDYENGNNVVYADPASDIGEFIANFKDIIQTRERAYSKYDGNLKMKEFYASLEPISLIVEDVDIFVEVLGSKVTELNSLLCRGLATQIHVYVTALSNKLKGFDAVSKTVRDNAQSGIVLGDPQSQQIFAIRKNELGKERGMSYVYENGVIAMVKIPRM